MGNPSNISILIEKQPGYQGFQVYILVIPRRVRGLSFQEIIHVTYTSHMRVVPSKVGTFEAPFGLHRPGPMVFGRAAFYRWKATHHQTRHHFPEAKLMQTVSFKFEAHEKVPATS